MGRGSSWRTDDWLVVVPFWATWPFETLVIAETRRSAGCRTSTTPQRDGLAAILIDLLGRYDDLFHRSFPYSMGWHQAPFDGDGRRRTTGSSTRTSTRHCSAPRACASSWSATSCWRKTQRDLSAEDAAERLRASSPIHYRVAKAAGHEVAPG